MFQFSTESTWFVLDVKTLREMNGIQLPLFFLLTYIYHTFLIP